MSIFSTVFNAAKTLVEKLGPVLPLLLDLIRTKTNNDDRDGIIKIATIFKAIGNAFNDLGNMMVAAVDESGPGGTAITGNEYAAVFDKIEEIKDEIEEALKA